MKYFNRRLIKSLIFCLLVISCQQEKIMVIKNTPNCIAFQRRPTAGNVIDYDIWLINIETGGEIQVTKDLRFWEYNPVWMNDSELLYLIEPQEKTMTETDIVYVNLSTGKKKIIDFWTWENDPWMDKLSVNSSKNIYYATLIPKDRQFAIYRLPLRTLYFRPEEVLSAVVINQFGFTYARNPTISPDGTKLLLVACDTAKHQRIKEIGKIASYDLYLYDIEADIMKNALKRLTSGDSTYEDPVWLDDNNIIFTSDRDGNYELYQMNIENRTLKRLTFSDHTEDTEAAVSPDGKKIAYSRYDKKLKKIEVWIMDLETQKTWFLTKGSAPDWSPAR